MKKQFIHYILILIFISCSQKNEEYLIDIKEAYSQRALVRNDSISINEILIIERFNVSQNYINEWYIYQYKKMIGFRKSALSQLMKVDSLDRENLKRLKRISLTVKKNKKEYLDEIVEAEKNLSSIQNEIKQTNDEIAISHQQIVLLNSYNMQDSPKNIEVVRFVFDGIYNGTKKKDTTLLVKSIKGELILIDDINLPNNL